MKTLNVSKIPFHPTIMIQVGSRLWFVKIKTLLLAGAVACATVLSSCASMQGSPDHSYTIDKYGNTSDGAQFVPSEGNVARDTAGRYYYKSNADSAYQTISTSEGQTCYTQNAGTAFERVLCY